MSSSNCGIFIINFMLTVFF